MFCCTFDSITSFYKMSFTTVYGLVFSPAVRSVLLTANLIGRKIVFKEVNLFKGQHLKPRYLKLNPLHTIPPAIDDDGFILFDSNEIVTYLVDKYAKNDSLYPKDLQTRAIVNQRLFFSIILFTAFKDWSAPFRPGNDGKKRPVLDKLLQMQLDHFEILLGDNFWVADTESPTEADICLFSTMDTVEFFMEDEITNRPKIRAWLKRMQSWAKANISIYRKVAEDSKSALFDTFATAFKAKL